MINNVQRCESTILFVVGLSLGRCEGREAKRFYGAAGRAGVLRHRQRPGGHLAKHPACHRPAPVPAHWAAFHGKHFVFRHLAHTEPFLGRRYLAVILHFLPKKLQSRFFFFLTYFLKNFSHYSKEYLNGHLKPRCLMTADLLKKGGEGGFALGGGRK